MRRGAQRAVAAVRVAAFLRATHRMSARSDGAVICAARLIRVATEVVQGKLSSLALSMALRLSAVVSAAGGEVADNRDPR